MKTAKTPAAANGKAASPATSTVADRAFLAENRRIVGLLKTAAKSAGVGLNEFLIRASFAAERRRRLARGLTDPAPFIRACVRHEEAMRWRVTDNIVSVGDLVRATEGGTPSRDFPRAFEHAPDCQAKEDARWMSYEDFCQVHGLVAHEDHLGLQHTNNLREDVEGETFSFSLIGTRKCSIRSCCTRVDSESGSTPATRI